MARLPFLQQPGATLALHQLRADHLLDRVAGVFFNLAGADANEVREALQRDMAPQLSALSSEITTNQAPWGRISTPRQARDQLGLSD